MHLNPLITTAVTGLCLAAAGPALATGTLALQGRESVSHIDLLGGHGISTVQFPCIGAEVEQCQVTGSTGSLAPVTSLAIRTIDVVGQGHGEDVSLVFATVFDASWSQTQTFDLVQAGNDTVLSGSGRVEVQMAVSGTTAGLPQPPESLTRWFQSRNLQTLYFSLDSSTSFQMAGGSFGGQKLEISRWSGSDWLSLTNESFPTVFESFDYGGSFQAGDYRLRNLQLTFGNGQNGLNNSWDFTLTLSPAVTPSPPISVAVWAAR